MDMATNAMGTVFSFTPSGGAKARVGRLSSVGEIAPTSEEIEITTLDSEGGFREYMQGLRSAGELTLEGFFDAEDEGQAALRAAYLSGEAGEAEVAFPDGSAAVFSAFVKGYKIGAAEVDGALGFSAELRITGAVAVQ